MVLDACRWWSTRLEKKEVRNLSALTTGEILEKVSDSGIAKAEGKTLRLLIWALLAGAYIAFGAQASQMVSFNLLADPDSLGMGRLVSAAVFPVGLMMVVLCGAELFTGNCLMIIGVLDRKIRISGMLRNWVLVYLGNFLGALLVVALMKSTGIWETGSGLLGASVIKTAQAKVQLSFGQAFVRGILCNWLVCLAVWMSTGARETVSKIFAIWFCIGLFVISGFEHSIANMYFIPAGIAAAADSGLAQLAGCDVSVLTVGNFLIKNLLPVTLGNILGGGLFVGMVYWFTGRKLK
ncbi:formate/nitrite transporter family protein [Clostridiales Family XIII bacterium BX16]|uniref:Formate/nitrite transporter family protein n=1 Tax=Lentihominibacter faecis TaxID=2764712 RepID=A0A923NCP6_9FIRM|nr:formate/nitrite transporter family protein [Lentihominibacter faecis]